MATVQDYTSMPWSIRSSSSSSTAGSASPSSDSTTVQASKTEALIQQLTESHAAHRELERRIADLYVDHAKRTQDLHVEYARRIQEVTRNLEQKSGDLVREVRQAERRENAVRAVFTQNVENEKASGCKMREIEEKMFVLEDREVKVKKAEVELEAREAKVKKEVLKLEIKKKVLEELLGEAFALPKHETTEPKPTKKAGRGLYMHESGNVQPLFQVRDKLKYEEYEFEVSFDTMNGHDIDLLRRHDYYKGWLDCARVLSQEEAIREGLLPLSGCPHFADVNHPKNPECAGINAGLLFTWAALCKEHKPEWSIRLDDRVHRMKDVAIPHHQKDTRFWVGVAGGVAHIEKMFWKDMTEIGEGPK